MKIGVPKETKIREYRVGMTPAGVRELTRRGHEVLVERGAGEGRGIGDQFYVEAGARIVPAAADAWGAELVVKVKEPLEPEFTFLREGLVLYTYLHLAAAPELTRELVRRRVTAVAYETIRTPDGRLPLLRPMSEVAGRMAGESGGGWLQRGGGGKGGVPRGGPGKRGGGGGGFGGGGGG